MSCGTEALPLRRYVLGATAAVAVLMFSIVFSNRGFRASTFWGAMIAAVVLLNIIAWWSDPSHVARAWSDLKSNPVWKIVLGVLAAGALYFVFVVGRLLAIALLPDAHAEIGAVYALKGSHSRIAVALALLLIAPGEELFWRRHLQSGFESWCRPGSALVLQAIVYAAAHTASGNLTLIAAALAAGLFWGVLYRVTRSPLTNMISHLVWAWLIFLIRPLS